MRLLIVKLIILTLSCCTYKEVVVADANLLDIGSDAKKELPEDINNIFSNYNHECENRDSELWEDECRSLICIRRSSYNLYIVNCKIQRLGFDVETCIMISKCYKVYISCVEDNCPNINTQDICQNKLDTCFNMY